VLIRDSLHGLDPLLRKTMVRVPYQHVKFEWRLPLWVKSPRTPGLSAMSGPECRPDENN